MQYKSLVKNLWCPNCEEYGTCMDPMCSAEASLFISKNFQLDQKIDWKKLLNSMATVEESSYWMPAIHYYLPKNLKEQHEEILESGPSVFDPGADVNKIILDKQSRVRDWMSSV